LCGSGMGNSPAGVTSHESRFPHLLAGASVVKACRLNGGSCGELASRGEEAAW
jgi:hypothetical protein